MKSWVYFDNVFNERQYQLPKIFNNDNTKNKVTCVSGVGERTFSVLMTDTIPNLHYMPSSQCFPLYWFDESGTRQDGITDNTLNTFRKHYKNLRIGKEDIFYYIYGLLHSENYRTKYKNNLDKSLPHIPLVSEFEQFLNIGRDLAELHLNYENQKTPNEIKILKEGRETNISKLSPKDLKIEKMRLVKKDKTKIQFNDFVTIANIPEEAWDYKINDWPAPKWVMERYQWKKDKKTDIVNDPNTYSEDPAYILKLLLSIITVSLKAGALVDSLPDVDFDEIASLMRKAA